MQKYARCTNKVHQLADLELTTHVGHGWMRDFKPNLAHLNVPQARVALVSCCIKRRIVECKLRISYCTYSTYVHVPVYELSDHMGPYE